MKYIVEVEKYKWESCKRRAEEGQNSWYHDMILEGTPLEKEAENIKRDLKKIFANKKSPMDVAEIKALIDGFFENYIERKC